MINNVEQFEVLMKEKNYNYRLLAKKINLNPSTLSSKIKGNRDLKFSEAIDIASILNMDKQQCLNCFFDLHKV